jgi:hypothetical protein
VVSGRQDDDGGPRERDQRRRDYDDGDRYSDRYADRYGDDRDRGSQRSTWERARNDRQGDDRRYDDGRRYDRRDAEPAPARTPRKRRFRLASGFATVRDLISFSAGMVIICHEVFFAHEVQAAAVGVGVALTGLPLVFGADERKAKAAEAGERGEHRK